MKSSFETRILTYGLDGMKMNEKGWTIVFTLWDDCKERVAGRFKTDQEKDEFLKEIRKPDSGWTNEELESVCSVNDYWYMLPV